MNNVFNTIELMYSSIMKFLVLLVFLKFGAMLEKSSIRPYSYSGLSCFLIKTSHFAGITNSSWPKHVLDFKKGQQNF
jgi:hypothetical protein